MPSNIDPSSLMDKSDLAIECQPGDDGQLLYTYQYGETDVQLLFQDQQRRVLRVEAERFPPFAATTTTWNGAAETHLLEFFAQELGLYIDEGSILRTTQTAEDTHLAWVILGAPFVELVDLRGDTLATLP